MITIKRLGPADAAALDRVAEDVFDSSIEPSQASRCLNKPDTFIIVAIDEAGLIVGQLLAFIHDRPDGPPEFYIDNVGITPDRRREGLANRSLDEAQRQTRASGCELAWVATENENEPARALYAARSGRSEPAAYLWQNRSVRDATALPFTTLCYDPETRRSLPSVFQQRREKSQRMPAISAKISPAKTDC